MPIPNASTPIPRVHKDLHVKHAIRPLKHLATHFDSEPKPEKD